MTYGLWINEGAIGCDYTIGCGEKLIKLKTPEMGDDLLCEVVELLEGLGFPEAEFAKAEIVEFKQSLNLNILAENLENDEEDDEDEATAERRRHYEELKKEFG